MLNICLIKIECEKVLLIKNSNKYLKNIIRQFIRINQREEIKRSSQYILPKINTQIGCFIVLFDNKKLCFWFYRLQWEGGKGNRHQEIHVLQLQKKKKLIKTCSTGDFVWAKLPSTSYLWPVKIENVDISDDHEEYHVYCKADTVM